MKQTINCLFRCSAVLRFGVLSIFYDFHNDNTSIVYLSLFFPDWGGIEVEGGWEGGGTYFFLQNVDV